MIRTKNNEIRLIAKDNGGCAKGVSLVNLETQNQKRNSHWTWM